MPKRIISDTTWKSKRVRSIQPPEFRPEYAWLMPIFEDNGVAELDAESMWSEAYGAARPDWTAERVEQLIDELIRVGLYEKYEADGKTLIYLVGSDKPGHLPPRSQRYSTLPLPSTYGKPKACTASATAAQGIAHTGIGFGTGIGSGSGTGNGTGTGTGQEQTQHGSVQLVDRTSSQDKTSIKTSGTASPNPAPRFGHSGSTALSLLAVTQHIGCVTGMAEIRANDPVLPLLTSLTEELLAAMQKQTVHLPPVGWNAERDGYECFVEVKPGEERYPGPDTPHLEGALSPREMAANWAWTQFGCAMDYLRVLAQYLPELSQEDVPEGKIEYTEEDMRKIMNGLLGFPNSMFSSVGANLSMSMIGAMAHWAFKVSNYWPDRLKSLDDFVTELPRIKGQYEKYYERAPEGKKPHDIGIGMPKEPQLAPTTS